MQQKLTAFKILSPFKAFLFLFIIGFLVASLKLLKTHLIFKGYHNPPPIIPYPSFFEYCAFSVIGYLFPYSWNKFKNSSKWRIIFVVVTSLVFVLIYLFLLNTLEWTFRRSDYNLWNGYLFSLSHSGLIVLLGYGVISSLIFSLGVVNPTENSKAAFLKHILYKMNNKTFSVDVADIQYFESNDNYISLFFDDDQHQLIRKTLNELEHQLDPEHFQRIHRKFIVNLHQISTTEINANGQTIIGMTNGKKLAVSKTYRSGLKAFL